MNDSMFSITQPKQDTLNIAVPIALKNVSKTESCTALSPSETRLYKRRFGFLLIISVGSMLSCITFSQYSIIGDVLKDYYKVSYIEINWTTMTYLVGYIVPVYPTIILFEKKGLKFVFISGLFLVASGLWVQGAGTHTDQFWGILLGQCIIALAQCCFINITPQFVSYWFDSDEVSSASAVGLLINTCGMALSCIFSSELVKSYLHIPISLKLSYLNYGLASATTILAILSIILFEERPPLPPCAAQAKIWDKEEKVSVATQLWDDLKELFKNRNFIVHLISASMMLSFVTFSLTILNQLITTKHPENSEDIGKIGLIMYFMGIPGTLIIGRILDKTRKYKETVLVNNICMFISLCLFVGSIYVNIAAIYAASVFFGFFMVNYLNSGLEMASEISYPVSEVASSSVVIFFGCGLGIVMTYVSNWLLEDAEFYVSLIVLLIYCFVGMLLSGFVKSDLRRTTASDTEKTTPPEDS